MTTSRYQYQLEILRDDFTLIGQLPITADWQPAVESARLSAIRAGRPIEIMAAPYAIDPIWHSEAGQPYITGFRVAMGGASGHACDFHYTYWRSLAQTAATALMDRKILQNGERFRYRVTAFPCEDTPPSSSESRLSVEEVSPDLQLCEGALADFVGQSSPMGLVRSGDTPVFIPTQVIQEAARMKDEAGATETGSILIGRLYVDRTGPTTELFAVVTAQVPARYTSNELARMTFTADTWADVHGAIALRGAGEVMLAWFHTHPTRHFCKCKDCDRSACSLNKDFFSIDDQHLHRSVFPRAWSSALVMSDVIVAPDVWTNSCSLFGWRNGVIVERGFYEIDPDRAGKSATSDPSEGGAKVVKRSGNPVPKSAVGGGRRSARA